MCTLEKKEANKCTRQVGFQKTNYKKIIKTVKCTQAFKKRSIKLF